MFCLQFYGNLAHSLGRTLCLDVDRCVSIYSLIEELLRSKGEPISVDELLITTADGKQVEHEATTCDLGEVRVLRLVRGG